MCTPGLGKVEGLRTLWGVGRVGLYTYKVLKLVQRAFENLNIYRYFVMEYWSFLVAQMVKKSVCNAGDRGQSLGGEDPLEEDMATHSSILAWRIPWTEEPGGLQSTGPQRVRHK